jgi:hypothetical protein
MSNQEMSEKLAAAANSTVRKYKSALSKRGPKVVMPGGYAHDATPYIAQTYKFRNATSIFNEPEKNLKNPKPGYHYAWAEFHSGGGRAREGSLRTEAMIRSGRYEVVSPSEMKEDTDVPFSKGVTGKRVEMYDVMLVAIPPRAWDELYSIREALGVTQVARHFEQFQDNVEQQGGEAEIEARVEK